MWLGYIYLLGGQSGYMDRNVGDVCLRFDLATQKFEQLASMRSGFVCVCLFVPLCFHLLFSFIE